MRTIEPSTFNLYLRLPPLESWTSPATHFHSRCFLDSSILLFHSSLSESDHGLQLHVHRDQRCYNWGVLKRTNAHPAAHMIGKVIEILDTRYDVVVWHAMNQLITTAYSNYSILFQHLIPNARDTCSTNATVNHCLQTVLVYFFWNIWLSHGFQLSVKSESLDSPRSLAPVPCNSCRCRRKSSSSCHSERSSLQRASRPREKKRHQETLQEHVWTRCLSKEVKGCMS